MVVEAETLIGVEPSTAMLRQALKRDRGSSSIVFANASAEALPIASGSMDLVVATTSFDHWDGQIEGLRECHRVLNDKGQLVCTDLFSKWLLPTLMLGRGTKARTKQRMESMLHQAGFGVTQWFPNFAGILQTVVAYRVENDRCGQRSIDREITPWPL